MGFIDNFTSDTPVTIKHDEYYALMREAAKAELLMNAVKAGVPSWYVDAMATGELKEPVSESMALEECKESLLTLPWDLDCCMWGRLAAAIKDIFNDTQDRDGIREMKEAMEDLTEALASARGREIWLSKERHKTDCWSCDTCQHKNEPITAEQILDGRPCDECEDGSNYQAKESEGSSNGNGTP